MSVFVNLQIQALGNEISCIRIRGAIDEIDNIFAGVKQWVRMFLANRFIVIILLPGHDSPCLLDAIAH